MSPSPFILMMATRVPRAFLIVAAAVMSLAFARSADADASDVSLLFVRKSELFRQNSPSDPALQSDPFTFEAGANPTGANRILSAQVTPRGGTTQDMTNSGGNFFFDGGTFATMADLDTAFPNVPYDFTLETSTPPTTYTDTVSITGNLYPANTPKILNGTWSLGALQIDATQSYTFNWNDVSPTNGTRMVFEIRDDSGAVVFTRIVAPDPSGFNISSNMPANTLQTAAYYTANLAFERRTVTTVSPTFTKVSTYATETSFKIATIAAPPGMIGPATPVGTVGQLFVYQIIASNHPFDYDVSSLPDGLTLDSTLGIISGVPSPKAVGATQITLSASNIDGVGNKNLTPTIQASPAAGPVIISSTCALAFAGQPFEFHVLTTGATSAARITATGLPAGLSLDPITGVISGTTSLVGSVPVNLTVKDGNFTATGFLQLTFTAEAGYPVITNADVVTVPRGQPFSYTIATPAADDPADPPAFTFIGTLPPGLKFDPGSGTISGIYTGPLTRSRTSSAGDGPPEVKELSGGALLGSIQLFGTNSHGTSTFQLLFLAPPSGAVNISTRLFVGTGENVLIGGFIVTGNAAKVVLVRALGPSLAFAGTLEDPTLELHDTLGGIVKNDNWRATQEQIIKDTTIPPTDDREAAIVISLDPGNYTALVSGKNGATGIALVELYDLGTAGGLESTTKAQLAQISTRGNVLQGDNVMIGGFIISGATTKVIVRAIGPSLENFGIANALADTTLELFNGNGTSLATNDDWRTDQEQAIKDTTVPPSDDLESAIVQSLVPGAYTAIVRGLDDATGVALVEVYALQ